MVNHTHFLKLLDFTPNEIQQFLKTAANLKAKKKAGIPHRYLEGKNVALLFEKDSTRTRCAFEVACRDLGMGSTYLGPSGSQMGKKESIADTARVLGRMYDGIEYRGYGQELVEALAKHAGVPVFNGLTNEFHPTQILADFLTIQEHCGKLKGVKLVYLGDARYNMGNSLMVGCAKMGMHFVACAPRGYLPDPALIEQCQAIAAETGATLEFSHNPMDATKGADILYTDVWVSMGESEHVWADRIAAMAPYRVTQTLMENAGSQCRFMHCLPAFHDRNTKIGEEIYERFGIDCMEVTDEVFEGNQSLVFDEAENRMHTIKAVLYLLMKDNDDPAEPADPVEVEPLSEEERIAVEAAAKAAAETAEAVETVGVMADAVAEAVADAVADAVAKAVADEKAKKRNRRAMRAERKLKEQSAGQDDMEIDPEHQS